MLEKVSQYGLLNVKETKHTIGKVVIIDTIYSISEAGYQFLNWLRMREKNKFDDIDS